MLMKDIIGFFTLLFFVLSGNLSLAQTSTKDTAVFIKVEKINGVTYLGKLISDDGREILLETNHIGRIFIPKNEIRSISEEKIRGRNMVNETAAYFAFNTRYAFTNNALPIKKGDHYASISWYGPEVHFAVSKGFSVGVMSTWLAVPVIIALKYTLPTKNEKLHFSLGSLLGSSSYANNFKGFGGLQWVTGTYGNTINNFSISLGYGYLKGGDMIEVANPGTYISPNYPLYVTEESPLRASPVFSMAGIIKVSKKASLFFDSMFSLSEQEKTYILNSGGFDFQTGKESPFITKVTKEEVWTSAFILMPGMRFQTKENQSFQVSLAGISLLDKNEKMSFPFPLINWYFKF
ncbi:MAG: hypothetical protein EBS35_03620 [Bacteroidetes bacterium]|nr:hypothetical protein [Bacteroidota bacterium]